MTQQLTAAHALLAKFVEKIEILGRLTDSGKSHGLTVEGLRLLADEARLLVNPTHRVADPVDPTSPPAPGTGFYPPHTAPAPVAPTEVKAPFPAGAPDPDARKYWVMDEQYPTGHGPDFAILDSLRATPEDELSDEGFSISLADYGTDKAVEAQADMWFHSRGFFKLSTSDALPADVMARALAAAYLVVRDAAYERFDNLSDRPADR